MSWAELSAEQAFSEGSTLWIVGDLESSLWASKINWYLNFQLRRARFHKSRELPAELVSVVQTWEVEAPQFDLDNSAPLLIETSKLLPAQMTVQILNKTFDSWTDQAQRIWTDLHKPSVRVFLPEGKTADALAAKWKLPADAQATYVLDHP